MLKKGRLFHFHQHHIVRISKELSRIQESTVVEKLLKLHMEPIFQETVLLSCEQTTILTLPKIVPGIYTQIHSRNSNRVFINNIN
jgi:hypothetical protein